MDDSSIWEDTLVGLSYSTRYKDWRVSDVTSGSHRDTSSTNLSLLDPRSCAMAKRSANLAEDLATLSSKSFLYSLCAASSFELLTVEPRSKASMTARISTQQYIRITGKRSRHTNYTGGSTVFATKRRNCIKDFISHLDKKFVKSQRNYSLTCTFLRQKVVVSLTFGPTRASSCKRACSTCRSLSLRSCRRTSSISVPGTKFLS